MSDNQTQRAREAAEEAVAFFFQDGASPFDADYYVHNVAAIIARHVNTDIARVPTNWLDPLLTGPNAVISGPPFDCQDIERLLKAVKERVIRALLITEQGVSGRGEGGDTQFDGEIELVGRMQNEKE